MADDIGGVWRTVGGRRIFIKNGQDLQTAMKKSGKFNNIKNKGLNSTEREENPLQRSLNALREIDNLAETASHYTNDFTEEKLADKGREMGSKEFREYVNKLQKESYEKRNSYEIGDTVDYDSNKRGVNPHYGEGKIIGVEGGLATHGDTSPDKVYKIEDSKNGNTFKLDAFCINKKIRK